MRRTIAVATILVLASASLGALDDETIPTELLLDAEATQAGGEELVSIGGEVSHYDLDGFPEDDAGQLVLAAHQEGPMVYLRGEDLGFLLYAQYVNQQRDAVFLARTGTIIDTLPDGSGHPIPFGYGAVKLNRVYVSVVEALLKPHISDNQKEYRAFPIEDLYAGAFVGIDGVGLAARYVLREMYTAHLQIGINPFGSAVAGSILNTYWVPIHLGAGYRFPGLFPEFLGQNLWTVGADLYAGLGDRDGDPATAPGFVLPGAFLDVERLLYDEHAVQVDFRTDPRPHNYRVNALNLRLGLYLDFPALVNGGGFLKALLSFGYQFTVLGPRIPEHEFKETKVLYVHDLYREDLERQRQRRAARAQR